jgi:hypothetical protein
MHLPGQVRQYRERERHVEMMRAGTDAYGVLCTSVEPDPVGARKTRNFDREHLLKLGRLIDRRGGVYAEIEGEVSVKDLFS